MPRRALIVLFALLAVGEPVSAQDKVKVGVSKLTSSAPIFVGVERGFFKATMPLKDIVDTSFLEAAIKAVGN